MRSRFFAIYPDFVMPADQVAAFKKERASCVLGEAIAKHLNVKVGDRLVITGDIYPVNLELTVAGIFTHPKNTESLLFHQEYLNELLPVNAEQRDMVGTYILRVDKPENMGRISDVIDKRFENDPYPTRTESEKAFWRFVPGVSGEFETVS